MDQRAIVERRCDSKSYFKHLGKATRVAEKLSKRNGELTIAYKCLDCDGYHVGHADLSQRLAHQQKPKKENWKQIRAKAMLNPCPQCKAKAGTPCMQNHPINGHTIEIPMKACHKGRAANV